MRAIFFIFLAIFLVSCGGSAPRKSTDSAKYSTSYVFAESTREGADIAIFAMGLLDTGYKFGGKNPEAGLDCSGMVAYVYREAAGVQLSGNAASLATQGKFILKTHLRAGDLVFFNTMNRKYSHVGIFLGDDKFIHAPNSKGRVRIEKLSTPYWAKRYDGGRTFFQ